MKLFRRHRAASASRETQFIMPKHVTWTVEDLQDLESRGDWSEALDRWRTLLEPFRDPRIAPRIAGMRSHRVIWLHIGLCCRHLERYEEALAAYAEAEALARRARDPQDLAEVLNTVGVVHRHREDLKRSLRELSKALRAAKSAGDTEIRAAVHDNIAHCYRLQGRRSDALREQKKAAALIEADPSGVSERVQGKVLGNLGVSYLEADCRERAIELLEQGLALSTRAGDHAQAALALENLEAIR